MRFLKLVAFVGVSLLVACNPATPSDSAPGEPTNQAGSPAVSGPSPLATPVSPLNSVIESPVIPDDQNLPEGVVIKFSRSGGFAGRTETFLIYEDGRIVGDQGQERQVTPEQVTTLLQQIEANGFFNLAGSYLPRDTCCDRFIYQITVHQAGQVSTVVTIDGAENQPEGLTSTLTAIMGLLSRVGL